MTRRNGLVGVVAVSLALCAAAVQAQNIDDMVKWVSAQVVHYDVVAEYAGPAEILLTRDPGGGKLAYSTTVKDRFEMSFDWNPTPGELVGKPTFRNFPTSLTSKLTGYMMFGATCPPPRVTGTYDHVEVVEGRNGVMGSNSIEFTMKRAYAAGALAIVGDDGKCNIWVEAPATVAPVTETTMPGIVVPPGMYLVMPPEALAKNVKVGKDGRTIVVDDSATVGWVFTHKLRIVK